ncbi:NAD(P)H-hydrate dehydratase [Bacillus sp. HMF5848]|uniref:NAD(P)H-hydrate dehydratase n=1 Tax=Bacillus sp. HMF5848 TaxID=2495421 RepID=UPI000F783A57|nr:NAD(P)H-hydrate dehydratase [Bacillus sp. HMF5848]RSK29015.1 NAD(P)H-hydrate dehydratase [Bacillus sp. HMF5848]
MKRIVKASHMYSIDQYTVEKIGISEAMLMENAGQACARLLMRELLSYHQKVLILIGTGNNGGDGVVIGRILKSHGYEVDVMLIGNKDKLSKAAAHALHVYEQSGYEISAYRKQSLSNYEVIIDAMLGIGTKGLLREPYASIISHINQLQRPLVVSIDIPSGVCADKADVTLALKANATIVIQHYKHSCFLFPARHYYGGIYVVDIGIPPKSSESVNDKRYVWEQSDVTQSLPIRHMNTHKGTYGKGIIVGGSPTMIGAPIMSAKAALRSGIGLLTMAMPKNIHTMLAGQVPEAMYMPYGESGPDFRDVRFNGLAIGPGLGRSDAAKSVVEQALLLDVPLVIDADGLYHICDFLDVVKQRTSPTILTPHAAEMGRLMELSVNEVEMNRFEVSRELATTLHVHVVLKGPYTIVTTPDGKQFVNTTGNPGLAKGGAGDVLTGMILAFILQGMEIQTAISNAVYIHGLASEQLIAEKFATMSILPTDVIEQLPTTIDSLLKQKE